VRRFLQSLVMAAMMLLAATALPPTPARADEARTVRLPAPPTSPPGSRPASQPASQPTTRPVETLSDAEALMQKGDYAAAEDGYRKLSAQPALRVAAAVGLARALETQGKVEQALEVLQAVADDAQAEPTWQLARAEVLATVGRYEEALAAATAACELRPKWAPGIYRRGMLLETLGRTAEAVAVYKTMEDIVTDEAAMRDSRQLVALGQILDRYAVRTGMKASAQADNIFNNYLRRAYHLDKDYWPAYVAAGMFSLAKHRPQTAAKEFAQANKINPRIADVHVGMAAIYLGGWQFERCEAAVKQALAINPRHADALLVQAVCRMQWRKFDEVEPILQSILKTNPNHLDALSLLAALHIRMDQPEEAAPYLQRVQAVNPRYSPLPTAIGEWLSAARRFEQAETYYRQAIALEPELAEPYASLGKLYMQTGQEDEAREVLAKAHEIDDFRADVVNYLRLLEKLKNYDVLETEHFIIKVDGRYDKVLLNQVAEYLEDIYDQVCGDYEYQPVDKTIIEIFPEHTTFSVRITGRGWVGTIGACTGRVIALVTPHPQRSNFGTQNWATVLRHEFTHAVTLAATDYRIPHWLTEACAVWQQPDKRNYAYVRMLVQATRAGRLFPIQELDWGFIRPKRGGDRSLAYAQAQWAMEYIITVKGYATIPRMLRAFREGLSQEEVFRRVVGIEEKDFDEAFRKWAAQQVVSWGYNADPLPNYAKAQAAAKENPDDLDVQAAWAVAQYLRRRNAPALRTAEKVLEKDPANVKALKVAALVQAALKQYDQAIALAQRLQQVAPAEATAPRVLARCYLARKQYAPAIAAMELLKQRQPYDSWPYEQLAKLYTQMGQVEKALPNLIHLHRHTMTDTKYARQIADICRTLQRDQTALEYYHEILHINPYEASAYKAIAEIQTRARNYAPAIQAAEEWTLIQDDSPEAWTTLALVRYRAAKATNDRALLEQARLAAEKALELSASSQARQVLMRIHRELDAVAPPSEAR